MEKARKISAIPMPVKIAFCSGADFWHTKAIPEEHIPAIMMADGPHGLRKQLHESDMLGVRQSVPATCFPAAVLTACSWDDDLLEKVGRAIAFEAAWHGVGLLLGPGANIKRNPLCGRNFEYFSEDPYLTGRLAAAFITGVEATGVASSLKHFACNNQEYKRFSSDSILDERTLREIYLAGFETAVRKGRPSTVMCAYNKINDEYCSDSSRLLTDILRNEWGFDGAVITDWGAMGDRIKGFRAGCDLSMPGGSAYMEAETARAVRSGQLEEAAVDRCFQRVLGLVTKADQAVRKAASLKLDAHHDLARLAAEQSAVLLKNEGDLLPLNIEKTAWIGRMAREIRYQGGGSSHVNPWKLPQLTDLCPETPYVPGYLASGQTTPELVAEAAALATDVHTAVVFAGLTDFDECEGFDRPDMKMPAGHIQLIEAVAAANPRTVVVLMCGSAVEIPWESRVPAILYLGLPGQAGAEALLNLLTGQAVPCGKLAESWPIRYEDCVSASFYSQDKKDAHYREGIYVGYRYYATSNRTVRFPFGHGLSYTRFTYSDLQITDGAVSLSVSNAGSQAASEIVQLYIEPPKDTVPGSGIHRPALELKGFYKVSLEPGESRVVSLTLDKRSFAIWNRRWTIPAGTYTIHVGPSSQNLPLSARMQLNARSDFDWLKSDEMSRDVRIDTAQKQQEETESGQTGQMTWYDAPRGTPGHADWEQLLGRTVSEKTQQKGQFTLENTVAEMKSSSLVMKIFYQVIRLMIHRRFGGKNGDPLHYRMMMASAADASLSSMKINAGYSHTVLEGLLDMANGHYFRGIRQVLRKQS